MRIGATPLAARRCRLNYPALCTSAWTASRLRLCLASFACRSRSFLSRRLPRVLTCIQPSRSIVSINPLFDIVDRRKVMKLEARSPDIHLIFFDRPSARFALVSPFPNEVPVCPPSLQPLRDPSVAGLDNGFMRRLTAR